MRAVSFAALIAALTACVAEDAANAPNDPVPAACADLPALHAAADLVIEGQAIPSDCRVGCDGSGEDRFFHFVAPEAGVWRLSAEGAAMLRVLDDCDVDAITSLSTILDDAAVKQVELPLEAGELVVIGVFTRMTTEADFEEMPPPAAFSLRAQQLPDRPANMVPASCGRHSPLYDPAEEDVWTADGVVEIHECDEGCGGGRDATWYFVAPADGLYIFEGTQRDDGLLRESAKVGIHADAACGALEEPYLDALPARISRQMTMGEAVGLTVVSTVYVGRYNELESTQMPFQISATLQP